MQVIQVHPDSELPKSELKVIVALKKVNAAHCLALHSIAWQGIRTNRQGDGEADFVILDGDRGIMVLEVKGGGIEMVDGAWFSTNARNECNPIKNPFEQARSSKHALLKFMMDAQLHREPSPLILRSARKRGSMSSTIPRCSTTSSGATAPTAALRR